MKLIPLHQNGIVQAHVKVDEVDYDALNRYRWRLSPNGYACRVSRRSGALKTYLMHREILGIEHRDRTRECEHRNRDRLDNQRNNLVIVTPAQNKQNTSAAKHGYRGIRLRQDQQVWEVKGQIGGVKLRLGQYATREQAAAIGVLWRSPTMPYAIESGQTWSDLDGAVGYLGTTPEEWLLYLKANMGPRAQVKALSVNMPTLTAWRDAA